MCAGGEEDDLETKGEGGVGGVRINRHIDFSSGIWMRSGNTLARTTRFYSWMGMIVSEHGEDLLRDDDKWGLRGLQRCLCCTQTWAPPVPLPPRRPTSSRARHSSTSDASPKGSRLERTVPENMTGSWGMMDRPAKMRGERRVYSEHRLLFTTKPSSLQAKNEAKQR
jgi:hypothetical protein